MTHPNYLSHHRKKWAMSQRELAHLLGHTSRSTVSRLELGSGVPSFTFALGCQVVFGVTICELFPKFFEERHDHVMLRAAELDRSLHGRSDAFSTRKRQLLAELIRRAPNTAEYDANAAG